MSHGVCKLLQQVRPTLWAGIHSLLNATAADWPTKMPVLCRQVSLARLLDGTGLGWPCRYLLSRMLFSVLRQLSYYLYVLASCLNQGTGENVRPCINLRRAFRFPSLRRIPPGKIGNKGYEPSSTDGSPLLFPFSTFQLPCFAAPKAVWADRGSEIGNTIS